MKALFLFKTFKPHIAPAPRILAKDRHAWTSQSPDRTAAGYKVCLDPK